MADDAVRYELDGHVATITYNRPEALNAINGDMRRDLNAAFDRFRDEEDAWVAIVTGAGQRVLRGRRHARRRGLGRRVRRHLLGEADDQLVRERLGDLQAGDRGGERLLPRLRAHARDVVRLRDRERARRVRLPRGRHRRADDRRRDPAPATHQLAVRDGAAAHRRAHRRGARQGDRARGLGRAARRAHDRGPHARRPAGARGAARRAGDQGGRGAVAAPHDRSRRSGSARRCAGSRRHRTTRPKAGARSAKAAPPRWTAT